MSYNIKKDDMTKIRYKKVPITTLIYKKLYYFIVFSFFIMVFETFAKGEFARSE